MKVTIRALTLLLAALFCLCPLSAFADTGAPPEVSAPPKILRACVEDIELPLVRRGEALTNIILPEQLRCEVGYNRSYNCPVAWEPLESVDTTRAGWTALRGTLLPVPDRFELPDDPTVELPVMVYDEGMEPESLRDNILICDKNGFARPITPVLMPQGGVIEDALPFLAYHAVCTAQNGMTFSAPLRWDLSACDPNETGSYTLRYTPELPSCFAMPESQPYFTTSLHVLRTDWIDFSAPLFHERTHTIYCQWYYEIEDPSQVTLEYAVNDGAWQRDETTLSVNMEPPMATGNITSAVITPTSFGVSTAYLPDEEGDNFYFRLTYQGKTTDALHIWYDGHQKIWSGEIGGDRDGGDYNPEDPPPLTQPPPSGGSSGGSSRNPESELDEPEATSEETADAIAPPAQAEPVQPPAAPPAGEDLWEQVTETSTLISGAQLAKMLASNGDSVLFEKQGVAVELPSAFLRGLNLSDDGTLEVRIEQPDERSFLLEVEVSGLPVSEIGETAVRLPLLLEPAEDPSRLVCTGAGGAEVSAVTYDAQNAVGKMTIRAAGAYRVVCSEPDPPVPAGDVPPAAATDTPEPVPPSGGRLWPVLLAVGAAVIAAAALWLWRRARHG